MLFNSYEFIFIFFPIVFFGFLIIGKFFNQWGAIIWLIAASLFFYAWWNPVFLPFILFSLLINYFIGVQQTLLNTNLILKKIWLIVGISANLGILFYFKYANFLTQIIYQLFHIIRPLDSIILPLGISFFTFTQIGYLVDCYRNETPKYNITHYCLFVTFFPHLIAGPIVHHHEIIPQFKNTNLHHLKMRNIVLGLTIFSIGLFKKVLFADGISNYVAPIFDAAEQGITLTFLDAWLGAISYSLQLYFDFSAYSDMAVGLAYFFNIRFPMNFNSPYKAKNIIDFWRRWHITLSRFLKIYLYIPLGGNRCGNYRRYFNLMITMLLGGLWHGAGWTFIFWGFLHGVYLIINHGWNACKKRLLISHINTFWSHLIARSLTFIAVVIAWVFFRANSLHAALSQVYSMLGLNFLHTPSKLMLLRSSIFFNHHEQMLFVIFLLIISWYAPNTQELFTPHFLPLKIDNICQNNNQNILSFSWSPDTIWAIGLGLMTCFAILNLGHISKFLYFQF